MWVSHKIFGDASHRTEEILSAYLGDAANKQSRDNLYWNCYYYPKTRKEVLDHWESME